MQYQHSLSDWLSLHQHQFYRVVPFDEAHDKLLQLDFTENNTSLTPQIFSDTEKYAQFISHQLQAAGARYGYGGYNEHRTVYSRSAHFGTEKGGEPRRLHLGIDIWGAAGTPVMAPVGGLVHSFAHNNNHGDYGATIILSHQLDGRSFYTLYGHLSQVDLELVREGNFIVGGEQFAHIGEPFENGNWPPHLHFQVIENIGTSRGDYPGVCRFSEREYYLSNCPNPDLILQLGKFAASI
jgi:murein DD-endopeptidase MepM/ murein hydrolase activator NlpD